MITIALSWAALANVILSFVDAYRMKKNIKIDHNVNAAIYLVFAVIIALVYGNIWFAVPILTIRPVIFDPMLNMLTGRNPFHVSMTTTSKIDRLERRITKNGFIQWLGWFGLTLLSMFIIHHAT